MGVDLVGGLIQQNIFNLKLYRQAKTEMIVSLIILRVFSSIF